MRSTWGLCAWFEELGTALIHPDDLDVVRALRPNGRVFRVVDADDAFLHLRYGDIVFRVRPAVFRPVPNHVRDVGESVVLLDGRSAEVIGIGWHHQRAEPMYQLRIEGKTQRRRYWASEFRAIEPG